MRDIVNTSRSVIVAMGLAAVLFLGIPAPNVGATGLGIAPSTLEIANALRGTEYEETITVLNPGESELNITLGTEGEISDWVSFYRADGSIVRTETIAIAGRENVSILVNFNIPPDTASGTYEGTVYAETIPGKVEGVGTEVVTRIRVPVSVTIIVTGEQILSGTVVDVSVNDVEIQYPLRINVGFSNTGNVVATPQIDVCITNGGTSLATVSYVGSAVKSGNYEIITVEWDTTGRELGDYGADVTVKLGGDTIGTRKLTFTILPLGTLTRAGMLTGISLQGEPVIGSLVVIGALFMNTGQIDTLAKFMGEVYFDGRLVNTVESEEILVPAGDAEMLESYLRLEDFGEYEIRGYAYYEGRKTEVKEISFTVVTSSQEGESQLGTVASVGQEDGEQPGHSLNMFPLIIIGIIAALVATIVLIEFRRRRLLSGKLFR